MASWWIECKANGGKPTALQMKNLRELSSAGGIAVLVDETGFNELSNLLNPAYRDWETDRKSTRLNSSHRL